MKRQIIAIAVGSLFALPVLANEEMDYPPQATTTVPGKTVKEVRNELIAARRAGDIVVNAETGEKANQVNPSAYPSRHRLAGKTAAEVFAELVDAQRNGEMVANAETGATENQL